MINEYNLVIIGNTSIGRYAGIKAVNQGARVALVLTPENNWITTGYLYHQVLNHLQIETSNFREIMAVSPHPPAPQTPREGEQEVDINEWNRYKQQADEVINNYFVYNNNDVLASLGIDVISGKGNFLKEPKLGFLVNDRVLKSKSYLIATGSYSPMPEIEGIKETNIITPDNIWLKLKGEKLAENWVIIGGNPRAIELTQTLINLGVKNISLIVKENHILGEEESEAGLLIQAYLESQGVTIFTQTEVKQIKQINQEKWVLIGNKALETEEILICSDPQVNIQDLNLENVGVKFNQKGIDINEKMQTSNPNIYACGDVISPYQLAHISQYQAEIAVKNALFFPIHKIEKKGIAYTIFSDPELGRVGLIENEARKLYGEKILILKAYFKTIPLGIISDNRGFAQIIVLENGEILGGTIVGKNVSDMMLILSLAIREKISIKKLGEYPLISPSYGDIFSKIGLEYERELMSRNKVLKNLLQRFFNWGRK